MKFRFETRNWVEYRALPGVAEVDFHFAPHESLGAFHANMQHGRERTLAALADAQCGGVRYLLFTHGHSTSGPGRMSMRSVVRGVMRSKDATPYIVRSKCIQHSSVFVAAIRPVPNRKEKAMNVDVYDSASRADLVLVVCAGSSTTPLIDDVRTGVALMAPLSLRAAGMPLHALVDSTLAGRIARMITAYGGALLRKTELLESVPDGRTRDEVNPPQARPAPAKC